MNSIQSKTIVVTGATSGIGYASALELAKHGFRVIGVGRSPQRCAQVEQALRAVHSQNQARCLVADLALQSQVRSLADAIRSQLDEWGAEGLDVLVNNAGIYSESYQRTSEGIERTLAVNHLAPFLLTLLLLPSLQQAQGARVITVSSDSHYTTWINPNRLNKVLLYFGLWAYKQSKLANVLFTLEFNRRYGSQGLRAFAVDPGLVNTDIAHKEQRGLSSLVWKLRQRAGVAAEAPARTILYLSGCPASELSEDLYWYDCRPKQPSRQALDSKTARALWQASCELCGIHDLEN